MNARDHLILALDVPTGAEAIKMVDRLSGVVGMFKVGSQLFTAAGHAFVRELVAREQKVFLDLKYHDIPNTVASAVAVAAQLGVTLVDVHALGGRTMIEGAASALNASATKLLAITVLTSHDDAWLGQVGMSRGLPDAVRRLALLARDSGADGVVASPHEIQLVRETCGPDFLIVTPGIRPEGSAAGDQSRAGRKLGRQPHAAEGPGAGQVLAKQILGIVRSVEGVVRVGEHAQAFVGSAGPQGPSPLPDLCPGSRHQRVEEPRPVLGFLVRW